MRPFLQNLCFLLKLIFGWWERLQREDNSNLIRNQLSRWISNEKQINSFSLSIYFRFFFVLFSSCYLFPWNEFYFIVDNVIKKHVNACYFFCSDNEKKTNYSNHITLSRYMGSKMKGILKRTPWKCSYQKNKGIIFPFNKSADIGNYVYLIWFKTKLILPGFVGCLRERK